MAAGMMDVLLVEDDPRIARVVERALPDVGHRVEVAHDGPEGLTSAERGTHDVSTRSRYRSYVRIR
jgi:two-component system copper resistance phosphate regulon response regulator CusR